MQPWERPTPNKAPSLRRKLSKFIFSAAEATAMIAGIYLIVLSKTVKAEILYQKQQYKNKNTRYGV